MGYEITKGKKSAFFLFLPCLIIVLTMFVELVVGSGSLAQGVPFENPTISKPITGLFLFKVFLTFWALISILIFYIMLNKKSIVIEHVPVQE